MINADWHLESISLYFWNITFVVVPCCKLSNVFLIKGKRFRLFGLNVEKRRRTCLFSFTFSGRRTSKGIIDSFFIPCVTISLGYFWKINKVFNFSNRSFLTLEFSTIVLILLARQKGMFLSSF